MNQETPEEKKLRIERQIDDANAYVEELKAKWRFPLVDKTKASRGVAIGPRANMRKILRDKRRKIGPIDPEYAEHLDKQIQERTTRISPEEASKLEKPCPYPPTYLYLVSAEKKGVQYWKVGITEKQNPLNRDPKVYQEVFRKEIFAWEYHARQVENAISRHYRSLNDAAESEGYEIIKPPSKEALAYSFSLETALEIYDWWVHLARTSDRNFCPYLSDFEDRPSLVFNYSGEGFQRMNETKFSYAESKINGLLVEEMHPDKRKSLRESRDYKKFKHYYAKGTEEKPFPVSSKQRQSRADMHHLFKLIDWLDPDYIRLISFRPDRIPSTPKTKDPEWD